MGIAFLFPDFLEMSETLTCAHHDAKISKVFLEEPRFGSFEDTERDKLLNLCSRYGMPLDNPFAILTAVVAPAVLTNASSVLCLGTSNRIARVVDRTRVVAAEIASLTPGSPECQVWISQLERLQVRAQLLFKALRILYASLGGFAAAALVSVLGSAMAFYGQQLAFRVAAVVGLLAGVFAVSGLVTGCILMVRETKFALENIAEEAELARTRYGSRGHVPVS